MATSVEAAVDGSDPSYIDYDLFLDPTFSASTFANTLVLNTNNAGDTPLDLATPLSRVLFDIQEVDSHIHALTSTSASSLLSHTQTQSDAATHIVSELSSQIGSLNDSYQRLEREITGRYEAAEEVRRVSERLWHTVRLGRAVGRALQLGRQLEVQMSELQAGTSNVTRKAREDHRAMVRASNSVKAIHELLQADRVGEEGEGLSKVDAIKTLSNTILIPGETMVRNRAQQVVREFSMSTLSSNSTYAQTEDTKSRMTSALLALYILSPSPDSNKTTKRQEGDLMVASLQDYLRTSLTSSLASLIRALGTLPTLERTLVEISARCQNIVALEILLGTIKPPTTSSGNVSDSTISIHATLLQPVLNSLETGSLPSYFWRTLAGNLSPKIQELMSRGGVQARTLKQKKDTVREGIRECVIRGSQAPQGATTLFGDKREIGWEREVGVMVGSVIGHLGR